MRNEYRTNTYVMFLFGFMLALFIVSIIAGYRVRDLEERIMVIEAIAGIEHVEG